MPQPLSRLRGRGLVFMYALYGPVVFRLFCPTARGAYRTRRMVPVRQHTVHSAMKTDASVVKDLVSIDMPFPESHTVAVICPRRSFDTARKSAGFQQCAADTARGEPGRTCTRIAATPRHNVTKRAAAPRHPSPAVFAVESQSAVPSARDTTIIDQWKSSEGGDVTDSTLTVPIPPYSTPSDGGEQEQNDYAAAIAADVERAYREVIQRGTNHGARHCIAARLRSDPRVLGILTICLSKRTLEHTRLPPRPSYLPRETQQLDEQQRIHAQKDEQPKCQELGGDVDRMANPSIQSVCH